MILWTRTWDFLVCNFSRVVKQLFEHCWINGCMSFLGIYVEKECRFVNKYSTKTSSLLGSFGPNGISGDQKRKEKRKLFRWPEWATLSATCFDKNSLPRRVLNFNLSYHCNSHAVAVTKLRGVYYPLPSSLHCSDHAGATTAPRGEFLTKLHIPHWAPPEHFCFMTLRLKRPIKVICVPQVLATTSQTHLGDFCGW